MAKKKITYEESVKNLQNIVLTIENGDIELEKCVELYKKGIDLAVQCGEILNKAEEEVMILKKQINQKALFLEEPFEEGED